VFLCSSSADYGGGALRPRGGARGGGGGGPKTFDIDTKTGLLFLALLGTIQGARVGAVG
jgi:hypothetical protein